MSEKFDFKQHDFYTNRELSWLDFNYRVLEEAKDKTNPLLERLKFLSITQSNLDEFFMVRVASLAKLAAVNYAKPDASGLTADAQLKAVNLKAHKMLIKQYNTLNRSLIPAVEQLGVRLKNRDTLDERQAQFVKNYFHDELYPVLTPMADDSSRPFPFIANNTMNIALRLNDGERDKELYATIPVPNSFPRIIALPGQTNEFILLEDIIKMFASRLFINYQIKEQTVFRVIRDMDLDVAEEDTSNLLKEVQQQLKKREHGNVIRLEVENNSSQKLLNRLVKELGAKRFAVYEINGPVNLTFLSELVKKIKGLDDQKYSAFTAHQALPLSSDGDIFAAIRQQDWVMQHPYDKFDSVVNFIGQAATDPAVLAIKMTLYRVSGNSPIIKYLGMAAQNGKQVTVLVEVKARFDEQNNVHWAQQLEKMGCHVIYGLLGLKTHCKLSLVVRREQGGIRRYMHMGTGNYNDATAHFYTDMGLFTANSDMGIDATNIFNMLSGYSKPPYFHQLHISPQGIWDFINDRLDQAIAVAKQDKTALVRMKMNSLSDQQIIAHLYEASRAGVKIELIVRGICCLKVGIEGVSDNITVHSIVGRFLEHSRIFIFDLDHEVSTYLASADMMTRNLNRRVELLFPINAIPTKSKVNQIFDTMWNDNVKSRILQSDDSYQRIDRRGIAKMSSQDVFIKNAERQMKAEKEDESPTTSENFKPLLSPKNQPNLLSDEGSDE